LLMSRAVDDAGAVQPTRAALLTEKGSQVSYHNHAIQVWQVAADNQVTNAYA